MNYIFEKIKNMWKNIKQKLINWCLDVEEVKIGELHNRYNTEPVEIYNKNELRERKINDLLGLPNGTFKIQKNLLEDLIKKDVKNNS